MKSRSLLVLVFSPSSTYTQPVVLGVVCCSLSKGSSRLTDGLDGTVHHVGQSQIEHTPFHRSALRFAKMTSSARKCHHPTPSQSPPNKKDGRNSTNTSLPLKVAKKREDSIGLQNSPRDRGSCQVTRASSHKWCDKSTNFLLFISTYYEFQAVFPNLKKRRSTYFHGLQ